MAEIKFGPYDGFVRQRLKSGYMEPLSIIDFIELRKFGEYTNYSDDFVRMIETFEDEFLANASACYNVLSALSAIMHVKGNSAEPIFRRVWEKFIVLMDRDVSDVPNSFDLNAAFCGIRLGMERGLDVSPLVEKIARYLKLTVDPSKLNIDRRDVWSVVVNHTDVLTSIYESDQHEEASSEIDNALEELKATLGK